MIYIYKQLIYIIYIIDIYIEHDIYITYNIHTMLYISYVYSLYYTYVYMSCYIHTKRSVCYRQPSPNPK